MAPLPAHGRGEWLLRAGFFNALRAGLEIWSEQRNRVDTGLDDAYKAPPATAGRFEAACSLTIASVEWKGYVGCARAFMTRVLFVREHGRWVWHLVIGDRWG